MAKLTCSDGTVIEISAETEQELREAFGSKLEPKPVYRVGDIVWRDRPCGSGSNYLQLREDYAGSGYVGLYDTAALSGNCTLYDHVPVSDPAAITHDEVCRMTFFPAGLRPVKKFKVTEIAD